jgi:F-type H+-transporting ATPase subunit delta
MKISKHARREAKQLFDVCRSNGVLDDAKVRQAVSSVIASKPRGYVGVLEHFQRLVRLDVERRSVRVENAIETTPALMETIKKNLEGRYGPGLNVSFWINPKLIGGLRVKAGSDIFDGSVSRRLNSLAETI